eukprot:1138339-Pelagomonas_calceolata.AAC.13
MHWHQKTEATNQEGNSMAGSAFMRRMNSKNTLNKVVQEGLDIQACVFGSWEPASRSMCVKQG